MTALFGVLSLLLGFFRDLGDIYRDPKTRMLLIWVGILLLVGTIFYSLVEGWSIVDAFYFSTITLTTVGYGDFSPATTAGKLFTTVYIFLGISVIVVFANTLARKHATRHTSRVQEEPAGGPAADTEAAC